MKYKCDLAHSKLIIMLLLALVVCGCSNLTYVNKPIIEWTPALDQVAEEQVVSERSPELLILLAFSGGGTRAASFAYGALRELAKTPVTTPSGTRSLLSEVDVISSVSGGSFASSYFGLHGEAGFDDFESKFLRQNVEGGLFLELLNPISWVELMSSTYSRTDVAAGYYDEILFNNAKFADFNRPGAPMILINSTDLATGLQFSFAQQFFDLICSDLKDYPVARAVAASSAVPILFSPITLKSYAGECGFKPQNLERQAQESSDDALRASEIQAYKGYLNRDERPWLHLVDGGIADNLGLRPFYNFINSIGAHGTALGAIDTSNLRQVLIISVDARAVPPAGWSLEQEAPGLSEVINSISSDQIDLYSADTIELVRDAFRLWTESKSTPENKIGFNFVEVSFDRVKDNSDRLFLNEVGTNFDLTKEQVDKLISSAGQVLRESPELRRFLDKARSK